MANEIPPRAGDICQECPEPDTVAVRKTHFGKPAWEIECPHAEELHVTGEGFVIECSRLKKQCCVDDSREIFVNSPQIFSLRSFFETTLKYLGIKP